MESFVANLNEMEAIRQNEAKQCMMQLIEHICGVERNLHYEQILDILNWTMAALKKEPILLEFELPEDGLVIVGDLHGDMDCLLQILEHYGPPPERTYLFMGDYIDRGCEGLQVLLLLFLLKVSFPEKIYLLRGNHERWYIEQPEYIHIPDYFYYQLTILHAYNPTIRDNILYPLFVLTFNHLSLCAIVSNHFLICHGGVSQWMTCRENLYKIKKPTDGSKMKLLEVLMVNDILWSDPVNVQEKAFVASRRGAGYTFNAEGLKAVLDALHVETLIRGHQHAPNGIDKCFGDESCFTVHSTTIGCEDSEGATMEILHDDQKKFLMRYRTTQPPVSSRLQRYLRGGLGGKLINNTPIIPHEHCAFDNIYMHEIQEYIKKYAFTKRNDPTWAVDTEDMLNYVRAKGKGFQLRDLEYMDARAAKNLVRKDRRIKEMFPPIYDAVRLKGGATYGYGSYRVYHTEEDLKIMREFLPFGDERLFTISGPIRSGFSGFQRRTQAISSTFRDIHISAKKKFKEIKQSVRERTSSILHSTKHRFRRDTDEDDNKNTRRTQRT